MSDILAEGSGETTVDPVSSFSFANVHEQALAQFGADETPAAPEQPEPTAAVETPVAEPPAPNVDNASAAKLASLNDEDLVEVTVDGEKVQMPWKDAKGGVMRQAHYTKSMQALRAEQQQFEASKASIAKDSENLQVLRGLLTNSDLLKQFIAKQHPALLQAQQQLENAAAKTDPNDLATVGQIQEAQRALIAQQQQMEEQFAQRLEQRAEALTREIEDRQVTAKLAMDIDSTIKGMFKEHAQVAELIPNADQVLRYEVLRLQPKTPEETLEAFKTVFGGWVEKFNATVKSTNKQAVIEKHKLSTNNIQPPGGAPPQPEPLSFKKVNKMTGKSEVDWAKVRQAALESLG